MKKNILIMVFGISLIITSCGEDDIIDFACDSVEADLREQVEIEIAAYEAAPDEASCVRLKEAIDAYRSSGCGPEDEFATERDALPEDCATINM